MLENQTCVFGPSLDGGYYFIGLACDELSQLEEIYQALFHKISFGVSTVLDQSLDRLEQAGINFCLTEKLNDVDLYEDIPPKISLIVPALNEEKNLAMLAKNIYPAFNYEVILVDGGSLDQTVELAKKLEFQTVQSKKGRSAQVLTGAKQAKGEILLFLHADSILPKNWDLTVRKIMQNKKTSLGYFLFALTEDFFAKKLLVSLTNFRAKYFKLPYGDQGLFVRKVDFEIWNLPEVPILEDVFMVKKAREFGKIEGSDATLKTSGRRWLKHGVFKTTWLNHQIMLGAKLNLDLELLKEAYAKAQSPFWLHFKKLWTKFKKNV